MFDDVRHIDYSDLDFLVFILPVRARNLIVWSSPFILPWKLQLTSCFIKVVLYFHSYLVVRTIAISKIEQAHAIKTVFICGSCKI